MFADSLVIVLLVSLPIVPAHFLREYIM